MGYWYRIFHCDSIRMKMPRVQDCAISVICFNKQVFRNLLPIVDLPVDLLFVLQNFYGIFPNRLWKMAEPNVTVTSGMKFRRALLQISKQLSESDVEQMKFLVAGLPDKPGHADVETAKTAMAFFMLLVKNEDISESKYYTSLAGS